jgi:hypothetical protein
MIFGGHNVQVIEKNGGPPETRTPDPLAEGGAPCQGTRSKGGLWSQDSGITVRVRLKIGKHAFSFSGTAIPYACTVCLHSARSIKINV